MSSMNSMRVIIEDYLLYKKAKALHRKQLAFVLSEIKAHYAYNHPDDHEWFLNDLKNHNHQEEPRLNGYGICVNYTYQMRNALYGISNSISIDTLLTDFGRSTILSYLV